MYGYQWPASREVRLLKAKARVQRPRPPFDVITVQSSEGDMLPPPPPIPKKPFEASMEKVDDFAMRFIDMLTDRICGVPQPLSSHKQDASRDDPTTEGETTSYDAVTMEEECVSQEDASYRENEC